MNAQRELVKVTAALEHAAARERAQARGRGGDHAVSVAQIQVAILRARAAQLRLLIAQSERTHRPLEEAGAGAAADMFSAR